MKGRLLTALWTFAGAFVLIGVILRSTATGSSLLNHSGDGQRGWGSVLLVAGVIFALAAVFVMIAVRPDPDPPLDDKAPDA